MFYVQFFRAELVHGLCHVVMASQCTDCGSTEVERDEQQGQVYCTGCGRVLQNYILLAQQQFQETSAGGIAAVGQHVGEGQDFLCH